MLDLSAVWAFHTDLRLLASDRADRERLAQQVDLATARRLGGVFSATGRLAGAPRAQQWELLESEVRTILALPGLPLARTAGDVAGGSRQVLHAEGVYFIQDAAGLADLDRMWEMGFRS